MSSYKKLYEFNTLEDFFLFQNTWKNNLPKLNLSMMLMMQLDNYEFIYPMWEDTNNQPGGCWSLKRHPLIQTMYFNYVFILQKM